MDPRAERLARNEALFRSANERIEARTAEVVDDLTAPIPFLCECSAVECSKRLMLTLFEYERVRSESTWFALSPGHVRPEVDEVLEHHEGWVLVRKYGQAAAVADQLDERH